MAPKLAREFASEHDGTPSFLAELQIGDARRGGHLHPRVSRGYDDLCSDVVRIIDMNNLEAEGTSRKRFPEPGQLLLFSCARTAPRRHRVVQEPERAVAARPTPVRGRRGSPRSCLAAGRRWGRRHRAAQRVSPKRSCLQNEARTVWIPEGVGRGAWPGRLGALPGGPVARSLPGRCRNPYLVVPQRMTQADLRDLRPTLRRLVAPRPPQTLAGAAVSSNRFRMLASHRTRTAETWTSTQDTTACS